MVPKVRHINRWRIFHRIHQPEGRVDARTFWANIEDSNNGYVFSGDEKKTVGKVFGGVFRIEQTEANNGNVYDHTRLAYTRVAQEIRDGKTTQDDEED